MVNTRPAMSWVNCTMIFWSLSVPCEIAVPADCSQRASVASHWQGLDHSPAGAFALYSITVDNDDPVGSNEERGLFALSGLLNAGLETLPEGIDDLASNIVNTVLNTFSFQWMK